MLLIWGFKGRMKTLDSGHFHCPREGGDRPYRRVEARRWFTFFWIPLIPLKVLGEFVECSSCGATYEPRVLTLPTNAQIEDRLTRALRHVVVAMLKADDVVDDAERTAALQVMGEFGLHQYTAADLDQDLVTLHVGSVDHELSELGSVLSPHGQESLVRACLILAAADGHVDDRELDLVTRAARGIGMSPAHLRGIVAELEAQEPA